MHKCHVFGDSVERAAAARSGRPGRKTRQLRGELGSGTEKRRGADNRVTAGLLAVQLHEWSSSLSLPLGAEAAEKR